jgi:alcohol oxidase
MYTRASASDYDDFQAKGWTTKELIPLMKKHETYQVNDIRSRLQPDIVGGVMYSG